MMQARALRVPELCDDHTPPSCLVTNSIVTIVKLGLRSVNTLVLPDPLHTITPAFCQVVRLGAPWPILFTCPCLYPPQLPAHLPFRCLPSLSFCAHIDDSQYMRLPLGTTEWNHSYYMGNFALSTTLSSTVTSWCELPVTCADVGLHTRVTWCSAFQFCVLPTSHTQCHQSTFSDGPHPHYYK